MRYTLLALGIMLIISCNNQADKEQVSEDTGIVTEEIILSPEEKLLWITDYDTVTGDFFLRQQRVVPAEELSPEQVIADINAAWEDIRMELRRISNDTIYVVIPQADHLTQQMGSAGATSYLAAATYSLTELKAIRYVNYDFEEGSHLSPGTYSREDFKNFH